VWKRAAAGVLVASAALGGWRAASAQDRSTGGDASRGRTLYGSDCAVCHAADGSGTHRGPDITSVGLASVDFQLRTGRMPLPPQESGRPAPDYDDGQILDVLAYVSSFVDGPGIPEVDLSEASLSSGQSFFQLNCAACHQSVGSGGILANDVEVPSLRESSAVEVVEAMRTGPGRMPVFGPDTFSTNDARDTAAYVEYLHDPEDRGGLDLGHYGPVPEGLVAVALGLGGAVTAARLLGTRSSSVEEGS
jgi:ubiquinol-cytochrome c reductase cytochrome c subunit